jgi:hypothetical protein
MAVDILRMTHRDHQGVLAQGRARLRREGGTAAVGDAYDRLIDEIEAAGSPYIVVTLSPSYCEGIGRQTQCGIGGKRIDVSYDHGVCVFRLWGGRDVTTNWQIPVMADRTAMAATLQAIVAKAAADPALFWRAA